MLIRISSRSSFLAKWQAYQVGLALFRADSSVKVEYHFRESLGDKNQKDPLWKMPEKGVFTEDFYEDLVENRTDLVVHSWKDLPTEKKDKSFIAATLNRADARDLVLLKKTSLGKKVLNVFSSSPRRAHHVGETLKWSLPFEVAEVRFADVRGNIQTRIQKLLDNSQIDALVLAKAALDRLMDASFYKDPEFLALQKKLLNDFQHFNFQILPLSENPTAAAQGALAVEVLNSRRDLFPLLAKMNHEGDFANCVYERKELSAHGGGCHQKIGLSCVNAGGQQVFFAAGVSSRNKVIAHRGLTNPKKFTFTDSEIATSTSLWESVSRTEIGSPRDLSGKAVFITKKEGLAGISLAGAFNYTAGLETWKHLAKQKIWVHGSTNSLGEDQLPEVTGWIKSALRLSDRYWYKLTHQDSPALSSSQPIVQIATYAIEFVPKLVPPAPGLKMIYWKSGNEFIKALSLWPQLQSLQHACGLGQTAKTIGSLLPGDKVTLYYDEKDWRKNVLSGL